MTADFPLFPTPISKDGAMSADKLVSMVNQIGVFFASQPGDAAASQIAAHLRKFWDPRMREKILIHLNNGGHGLDDAARAAVASLRPAHVEQQTAASAA